MKTVIDLKDHLFIQDHQLRHHVVIPATWYLEAMLSQGLKTTKLPISISDIHYLKAVNITPNTNYLSDIRLDKGHYEILININDEWELCATGLVLSKQDLKESSFNREAVLSRCTKHHTKTTYYQHLSHLHYDFGPMHQGLEELYIGKDEAFGTIHFLPTLEPSRYIIHPAFLDACSHVGLSLLPEVNAREVFLTTAQERVTLFCLFPETVWCYAKKVKETDKILHLDFMIFAPDNQLLAEIKGYQLQRIPISLLLPTKESQPFYRLGWEEKSLPEVSNHLPKEKIILNHEEVHVPLPQIFNPATTAIILFLNNEDSVYDNNLQALHSLLVFSQNLYHQQINELYRLIVIVEHEADLPMRQENIHLHKACIPGFCRTMQQEFPGWQVSCLYVGAHTREEVLVLVDLELSTPYKDLDIAYRQSNRYVLRLDPIETEPAALPPQYKLAYQKQSTLQETQWVATQSPPLQGHEVEIQVAASSINFRDVLILLNQYPEEHARPGIDGSGIISRVGHGVASLKPGDEVLFIGQHEFANLITLPEHSIIKKPSHLHLIEAAGIPIVFITAFYALVTFGHLRKNQVILIHSAAGGVGTAAVLIAKKLGATIYATAHPSKWGSLYALGVTKCYSSRDLIFAQEIAPQSIDLVLNNLIGDYIPLSLSLLKENGIFIEIGNKEIWSVEKIHNTRPDVTYVPLNVLHEQEKNPVSFHNSFLQLHDFIEKNHIIIPSLKVYAPQEIQQAFRDMINAKHQGKLLIVHEHVPTVCIKNDASYLITGGLGGIGRKLMDYLLEQQAGRIYLLNRHKTDDPPQDARVVLLTGDVADENDIIKLLEEINHSSFPLKGIFHAAGISDDNIIPNLSTEQIDAVLQAKLLGAWNLHRHTQALSLDHFVLFSSVVSLLGTPGLANYAAANGFLDQLAAYRHFRGLPALSINWGPWEVGMLQKRGSEISQHWLNMGFSIMNSKIALHYLEIALQSKTYQIAIMPVQWNKLLSSFDSENSPSLLEGWAEHAQNNVAPKPTESEFLNKLANLPEPGKTQLLINYLQQEVEHLTGNKITNLNLPFTELGITSLTAIEMTQNVSSKLRLTLPQTLLFNYTQIPILADYLLMDKLGLKAKITIAKKQAKTPAKTEDISHLADNEVIDLLDAALKDIDDLL